MSSTPKRPLLSAPLFLGALILLIDPTVAVFELLPDALGYFLLALSFGEMVDFVPHFAEAAAKFRRMAIVSLVKLPAGMFLLFLLGTSTDTRSTVAVVAFSFAIVDMIFLFPALKELFAGLTVLTTRFDVPDMRDEQKNVSVLTVIFVVAKALFSALPEMTLLFYRDPISSDLTPSPARYFGVLVVIAALCSLLLGIFWVIRVSPFLRRIARACQEAPVLLAHRERSLPTHLARTQRRHLDLLFGILAAAALCSCDLWVDGVNLLPDALCGGFLLLFAGLARRFQLLPPRMTRPLFYSSLIFSLSGVGNAVVGGVYAYHFDSFTQVGRKILATKIYGIWLGTAAAEAVLGILTLFCLLRCLFFMTAAHTGSPRLAGDPKTEEKNRLRRLSVEAALGGGIAFLLTPIHLRLQSVTVSVPSDPKYTDGIMSIQRYGWFWMLAFALSLVFFILSLRLLYAFRTEAELRYPDVEPDQPDRSAPSD